MSDREVPMVRRAVLLLPWPCLIGSMAALVFGGSRWLFWALFLLPIAFYVVTLQIVEPWLARRKR